MRRILHLLSQVSALVKFFTSYLRKFPNKKILDFFCGNKIIYMLINGSSGYIKIFSF